MFGRYIVPIWILIRKYQFTNKENANIPRTEIFNISKKENVNTTETENFNISSTISMINNVPNATDKFDYNFYFYIFYDYRHLMHRL